MAYEGPLVAGTFLGRRKRFFADVRLADGTEVVAHCANTGSMRGLDRPGAPCRVLHHADPRRKLAWSLEQLHVDGTWVMVHTARPNHVVRQAIADGVLPSLAGWPVVRPEQPYGERSRIDLLLLDGGDLAPGSAPVRRGGRVLQPARRACFVEVKNVTWVRDGVACFPDAVSDRGTRHLRELTAVVAGGQRAVVVLHVARDDAHAFAPADDTDPAWGAAFRDALDAGVEALAVTVDVSATHLRVARTLPIRRFAASG
ncbi:MAG: DNA/RNA nuclease SfsA [Alphaproteobacteria bacterium]|nr:DNA/RNA nuclease SfsA [Alphaproteobacteria bacterium]